MTLSRASLRTVIATVSIAVVAALAPAAHAAAQSDVVGGTVAAQGTLPSMAYISTLFSDGTGETCSGTVISPTLILTAAHCAESLTTGIPYPAADFQITTGLANVNAAHGGWTSAVSAVYINPSFHIGSESGDAAVLQLKTPTGAPAVALANAAQVGQLGPGTTGILAGWGRTSGSSTSPLSILHEAQQTELDPTTCSADWGQSFDPTTQICSLNLPAQTAGACQGDSGGALLANANGTTVELGVTIFVAAGCTTTTPTVYTSATAISGWVQALIAAQPKSNVAAQSSATVAAKSKPRVDPDRKADLAAADRAADRRAAHRRVVQLARQG